MGKSQSFRDLLIWQRSHAFTLNIYTLTKAFPKSEMFGLTSQMRRSSVSISANIAESEDHHKKRKQDFLIFHWRHSTKHGIT